MRTMARLFRGRAARRAALQIALLLLAACRTAPADSPVAEGGGPVTFRVLESGSYGIAANAEAGTERDARVFVARDPARYATLWREHVDDSGAPPHVDFARESAVFLLLGQRSTGGWGVAPQAVAVEGTSVTVTAPIRRPEPGGVATMAFSAPFAVIAVGRAGLTGATWKDASGTVVSAAEPPR